MRKPDPQLIEFLSRYPPEVCKLMLAVRRLVLTEIPSVSETVNDVGYTVTNAFTFSGRFKEAFCYVVAGKSSVNLGFPKATTMPDPEGKLKGTGKLHRHLRIETEADLEKPEVLRFIRLAANRAEVGTGPVALKPMVTVRGPALKKRPQRSRPRPGP